MHRRMETQMSRVTVEKTTPVKTSNLPANHLSLHSHSGGELLAGNGMTLEPLVKRARQTHVQLSKYHIHICTKVLSIFSLNLETQVYGGGLFLLSSYVFINFSYTC